MSTLSTTRMFISTDVTDWTPHQRDQLFAAIAAVEADFAVPDLAEVESTGWTLDTYHEAIAALLGSHVVQAKVITEAIRNGGAIDRAQVYELGGYKSDRSLKGFTRPVNRLMVQLIESGKLPEDAEDLLAPVYDPAVKGFQRAKGFRVPLEVVKLLLDANGGQMPPAST